MSDLRFKWVICKDFTEFAYYVKHVTPDRFKFQWRALIRADTIRGLRNPSGVFYGRWMENPEIDDIIMYLRTSMDWSDNPGVLKAVEMLQKRNAK